MPTDTPSAMLVWTDGYHSADAAIVCCEARTPLLGRYEITKKPEGWLAVLIGAGSSLCGLHPDLPSARAACEADYARRCREAGLVPAGGEPRRETGCRDRIGRMIYLGDRVRYRLEGPHFKEEYWNPEYEVIWVPPTFTLKHVGGGKDGGTHSFILRHGGANGDLEIVDRALTATPLAPTSAAPAVSADAVRAERLLAAVDRLGLRALVSGWNGEDREMPYEPHADRLRVKLDTTAGAVYEIDAAAEAFRALLPKPTPQEEQADG